MSRCRCGNWFSAIPGLIFGFTLTIFGCRIPMLGELLNYDFRISVYLAGLKALVLTSICIALLITKTNWSILSSHRLRMDCSTAAQAFLMPCICFARERGILETYLPFELYDPLSFRSIVPLSGLAICSSQGLPSFETTPAFRNCPLRTHAPLNL